MHKLFQPKLFALTLKRPILGPQKKGVVPHFLGKNAKKGSTLTFPGEFLGKKGGPKRTILGHKRLKKKTYIYIYIYSFFPALLPVISSLFRPFSWRHLFNKNLFFSGHVESSAGCRSAAEIPERRSARGCDSSWSACTTTDI